MSGSAPAFFQALAPDTPETATSIKRAAEFFAAPPRRAEDTNSITNAVVIGAELATLLRDELMQNGHSRSRATKAADNNMSSNFMVERIQHREELSRQRLEDEAGNVAGCDAGGFMLVEPDVDHVANAAADISAEDLVRISLADAMCPCDICCPAVAPCDIGAIEPRAERSDFEVLVIAGIVLASWLNAVSYFWA